MPCCSTSGIRWYCKVADLDDASARWSPVGTGTSLLWLVRHMARAEITWMLYRFAGQDVVIPGDQPEPGDTLEAVTASYQRVWQSSTRRSQPAVQPSHAAGLY